MYENVVSSKRMRLWRAGIWVVQGIGSSRTCMICVPLAYVHASSPTCMHPRLRACRVAAMSEDKRASQFSTPTEARVVLRLTLFFDLHSDNQARLSLSWFSFRSEHREDAVQRNVHHETRDLSPHTGQAIRCAAEEACLETRAGSSHCAKYCDGDQRQPAVRGFPLVERKEPGIGALVRVSEKCRSGRLEDRMWSIRRLSGVG